MPAFRDDMVVPAIQADADQAKTVQFYLDSSDRNAVGLIERIMNRLLELGFRVYAAIVSGLARPRMVIGGDVYNGVEEITSAVAGIEGASVAKSGLSAA